MRPPLWRCRRVSTEGAECAEGTRGVGARAGISAAGQRHIAGAQDLEEAQG